MRSTKKQDIKSSESGRNQKHVPPTSNPVGAARQVVSDAAELDARTRRLVDAAEKHINGLMAEAGSKYDALSDYVIDEVFEGDMLAALTPGRSASPAFAELLRRSETSLHIPRSKLTKAARIGALNRHLSGTPWKGLNWSVKQELLPLVGADGDLSALKEGTRVASKGLGMRAVRDWVAAKAAGGASVTDGQEETLTPTIAATRKALEVGNRLSKAADRRRWLDRAEKLPEAERDDLLASLRSASKQFSKLLADFESARQEA